MTGRQELCLGCIEEAVLARMVRPPLPSMCLLLRLRLPLPFAAAEYFYNKTQHLAWMMESISDEMRQQNRPFNAMDKAHQLVPIQKFLTAVKNDVQETCEAIRDVSGGTLGGGGGVRW